MAKLPKTFELDLEKLTLPQLQDLLEKTGERIKLLDKTARRDAVAALHRTAREHGFSLIELVGVHVRGGGGATGPRKPKEADVEGARAEARAELEAAEV